MYICVKLTDAKEKNPEDIYVAIVFRICKIMPENMKIRKTIKLFLYEVVNIWS